MRDSCETHVIGQVCELEDVAAATAGLGCGFVGGRGFFLPLALLVLELLFQPLESVDVEGLFVDLSEVSGANLPCPAFGRPAGS